MGFCDKKMGVTELTFSDVESFCNTSSYTLTGWEAEQLVFMSRAFCSMLSKASNDIAVQAPYNLAASDEHALQKNRDKVAQQFASMKKKRAS